MRPDLDAAIFSQRDVDRCTSADNKTLDNYIRHGHLTPFRAGERRMFSLRQMIETEITFRLASIAAIPPRTGSIIARKLLDWMPGQMLTNDAATVGDNDWASAAHYRGQVTILRSGDGDVEMLEASDPHAVDLVFPVQLFARQVMVAASVLSAQSEPVAKAEEGSLVS